MASKANTKLGRWIHSMTSQSSYKWKCSLCKKTAYYPYRSTQKTINGLPVCNYSYCPNCGKPMNTDPRIIATEVVPRDISE